MPTYANDLDDVSDVQERMIESHQKENPEVSDPRDTGDTVIIGTDDEHRIHQFDRDINAVWVYFHKKRKGYRLGDRTLDDWREMVDDACGWKRTNEEVFGDA